MTQLVREMMSPVLKATLMARMREIKPAIPFDLRPQPPCDGRPVLFIDRNRLELEQRYALLDEWYATMQMLERA